MNLLILSLNIYSSLGGYLGTCCTVLCPEWYYVWSRKFFSEIVVCLFLHFLCSHCCCEFWKNLICWDFHSSLPRRRTVVSIVPLSVDSVLFMLCLTQLLAVVRLLLILNSLRVCVSNKFGYFCMIHWLLRWCLICFCNAVVLNAVHILSDSDQNLWEFVSNVILQFWRLFWCRSSNC